MIHQERREPDGRRLNGVSLLRVICLLVCSALSLLLPVRAPAADSTYPAKVIKMVVPNAPGGGSDLVGRLIAEKLSRTLGQQVIVENRGGAGGQLAAEYVARSAPNGYTLLIGTNATVITAPALYAKLPYDPAKDFAPISSLALAPYLLVINPSLPAKSLKEFIDLAKSRPGRLNYASTGRGSPAHLAGLLFNSMAGINTVHVPYKGSSPGTMSVLQGETDLMFSNILPALAHIKSNRLRPLAISSLKRSSLLPDIPTLDESGLRGFQVIQFYSVLAPAGTSSDIVRKLNLEITKEMQSTDTKRRLAADGSEVMSSTPEELGRFIVDQIGTWKQVIRDAGIAPE